MPKSIVALSLAAGALALGGCSLAPAYRKPDVALPAAYPTGAPAAAAPALLAWDGFVQNDELRALVALALRNNRDLRQSVLNAAIARAQFKAVRAERLPQVAASGSVQRSRLPVSERQVAAEPFETQYAANLGLSAFEADLFGRVRNLSAAAFQEYLATEQGARAARISLIAGVATTYLGYSEAEARAALAEDVLKARTQALELVRLRREHAAASALDVQEAEGLLEQARVDRIATEREVFQARNALRLLLGDSAQTVVLHPAAPESELFGDVPAGLPSALLNRRPDILAAEHQLRAAQASIGAARAAFFPQISLTAMMGGVSPELSQLFDADSRKWQFVPQVTLPLFAGGRNRANLTIANLRRDSAVAAYEQTVQRAFIEVSDALQARSTWEQQHAAQRSLARSSADSLDLAKARYEAGVDGHLRYLEAQIREANSRRDLIVAWSSAQASRVTLYQVLGGTAETEPAKATPAGR